MAGPQTRWGMVIDIDRCTGCQACVVACWAENNVTINTQDIVDQFRGYYWIRIERYWEGAYPNLKVRYLPVLCQHCGNAPCEPVCPVYATHRTDDGLNAQVYNRCVGTRYCANNCPYNVRFFNFWERWPLPEPDNPEAKGKGMNSYLNPDVTIRSHGIMEKCSFCVQRIRRAGRQASREGRDVRDGEILPACVQTCPTGVFTFGNLADPNSKVARLAQDPRHYRLLENLGTDTSVIYLKRIDVDV